MDSEKLAQALADRFQRIVPVGYTVYADRGMIWYHGRSSPDGYGGGSSGGYVAQNLGSFEEQVAWCAENALDQLQDHIDETSTEPWPGKRTVPQAHAAVIEGKLKMWFGDADAPVLECEPIDLATLD